MTLPGNSKLEYLISKQIRMSKNGEIPNGAWAMTVFRYLDFVLVSDFEVRISDLFLNSAFMIRRC